MIYNERSYNIMLFYNKNNRNIFRNHKKQIETDIKKGVSLLDNQLRTPFKVEAKRVQPLLRAISFSSQIKLNINSSMALYYLDFINDSIFIYENIHPHDFATVYMNKYLEPLRYKIVIVNSKGKSLNKYLMV